MGWKMGGERDVFISPPKGHQALEPFIGHQAKCFPVDHQIYNLPLAIKQNASPLTSKHGTFQGPPSLEPPIGHQAWNLPSATKLGTFHWPPSWGFFSRLSFLFFLKTQIWIICFSFRTWFLIWIFGNLFPQLSLEGEK